MHHAFDVGDREHGVELSRTPGGYRLHLEDAPAQDIVLRHEADGRLQLAIGGREIEALVAVRGDELFVHLDGEAHVLRYRHPLERLAAQQHGGAGDQIRAPMPGAVITVVAIAGAVVGRGEILLIMESMKMETTLVAPRDGVIEAVHVAAGQSFERDALLLSLAPPP